MQNLFIVLNIAKILDSEKKALQKSPPIRSMFQRTASNTMTKTEGLNCIHLLQLAYFDKTDTTKV